MKNLQLSTKNGGKRELNYGHKYPNIYLLKLIMLFIINNSYTVNY